MGVDEAFQGLGAGKLLFETALTTAKQMGALRIILYSNTILAPALSIYRKYGFVEVPLEKGLYKRSDIKMELPVTSHI
ncbi:GNAT family N-acetyltransferase [Oscillatoria amoena NRMC-F 0135]|nr:GNAT family N-acetyltransferase [Oscillatoria amoena NRMC-F 0135]